MVTSHDVARLAGVSQATVSRALRDDPKVASDTKRKVREAASALGYALNPIGRALAVGRSTRVGLVITDLDNQFYSYVISPMHQELERLGYELLLITESSEQAPVVEHIISAGLCGAVLATTTLDSVLPVRLADRGVPFVYFNRTAPGVAADAVTVDPRPGMTALVEDLVRLGHRRVGAVFGPRNTSTGEEREQVLRALLDDHGISLAGRHVRRGPFDFRTGHAAMHELLGGEAPPTAVVCANDVVALGALNAAVERKIRVPEDISVVGFDDLPTSDWALVQLSTVAYDLDEMSRAAARLLVERVEGGDGAGPRTSAFSTRYVRRGTLGPAAD